MHQAKLFSVDEVRRKIVHDAFEVEQLAEAIHLSKQTFGSPVPNEDDSATDKEINQMFETMIDEEFLR